MIRQNNTQIQIAETLKEINAKLERTRPTVSPIPEDLITKLSNLSLGPKERPREARGKLRVFVDPYQILKEEQEKHVPDLI